MMMMMLPMTNKNWVEERQESEDEGEIFFDVKIVFWCLLIHSYLLLKSLNGFSVVMPHAA